MLIIPFPTYPVFTFIIFIFLTSISPHTNWHYRGLFHGVFLPFSVILSSLQILFLRSSRAVLILYP